MPDRYFVDQPIAGDRALLSGAEAHHLTRVMRAKPGDRVVVFDGSGAEFTGVVGRTSGADVELTLLEGREIDRELPCHLTLGVALPKGDRQKWLVEKAVELGVARIVPLVTARSVAQPVPQAIERLRRTVIEATKQCGRNRLLEIAAPQEWRDFATGHGDVACRLLAHPHAGDATDARGPWCASTESAPKEALLAVGPEGGWTDEEVSLALASGWQAVDLGPRILRIETAALLLVALLGVRP